ncbi:MAG: sigma-54 dependent transcriptional regulator [Acidobacteria bacterium]|nr:sigma-54 dependent transcriptional regulator [Acidobacteriota bacterium]
MRGKILIVDDDANFRSSTREFLQLQGYEVNEAESCRATLNVFSDYDPDVVISDYSLPDGNALELLPRLKSADPTLGFLVITGHGIIGLAVQVIKAGADHFLTKPIEPTSLLEAIQQALGHRRNGKNRPVDQPRKLRPSHDPFLGNSPAIRAISQKAKKLLTTDYPILIQGETGTGKGVLAKWLHYHGPRRDKPFVDLNCASLSRELLESNLFGHERGAFTGAVAAKKGLFEVAHGGTVFLDEIGDMDMHVQSQLLKVLEEKWFRRLGDVNERYADIRLIVATHKDLRTLVRENKFRLDLYFRINTFPLRLPSLRERIEDIPVLAQRMLGEIVDQLGCDDLVLSPGLEKTLQSYLWPGNIRELRQALERVVLFGEEDTLPSKDLRVEYSSDGAVAYMRRILNLSELECKYIENVLQIEHGCIEESAKKLGLSRSQLYKKIKKYGINLSRVSKTSLTSETNWSTGSGCRDLPSEQTIEPS